MRVNSFAANNTRSLDESSDFSTSLRYRNARVDWNVVLARLENRKVDTHRSMSRYPRNIQVIPRSENVWAALFRFSIMFNVQNLSEWCKPSFVGGENEKYSMSVPNKRIIIYIDPWETVNVVFVVLWAKIILFSVIIQENESSPVGIFLSSIYIFFNRKMWNENRVESISFVVVNRFRIELEQSRPTAFLYVLRVGMYI